MSEKDNNIIDILGELGNFEISDQTTNADIEKTRAAIQSYQPGSERKWSYIMNHKLTSIAAALVIIIGVFFALNRGGVSPDGATVAWADVMKCIDNMKNEAWVHGVNTSPNKDECQEQWISLSNKIIATKKADGILEFRDNKQKVKYEYNPLLNAINKSSFYKSSDITTELADNPVDYTRKLVEMLVALMDPYEFDIKTHKRELGPEGSNVFEYTQEGTRKDKAKTQTKFARLTIIIDEYAGLLKEVYVYADNTDSVVDLTISFDYPEFGPASVYDMGAPTDAEVVDNTGGQQLLELCDKYEKARESFLDKRVTIIDNGRKEYTIMYSDRDKFRFDTITAYDPHVLFGPEDAINNVIYRKSQVCNSEYFDKLQKELFSIEFCVCRAEIYKEQIHYSLEYETPDADDLANGKWQIEEIDSLHKLSTESDINNSFISLCWPNEILEGGFHRTKISIISDIYSEKHGFICVELLSDGWGYEGRIGRLPERILYYIDPNKDYLCHRTVRQEIRDAWWQVDTNWLDGLENISNKQDRQAITEVVEYGQTSAGQWYPKKRSATTEIDNYDCQTEYELGRGSSITIYENPAFEDGFFDPELILDKQRP